MCTQQRDQPAESRLPGSPPFHIVLLHPGGVFKLELFLPEEYPMAAPKVTCFARRWPRWTSTHPTTAHQVRFLTKIYHPNIDKARHRLRESCHAHGHVQRLTQHPPGSPPSQLGRICLDILKDKWSPALQIRTVLLR